MAAIHVMSGPRTTAGQRLGSYQLIELLGAGGMGEVWRALDPGLRRNVAIKILPPQYVLDPDRLRRFEQEAHAVGRLNHPNVLSVFAVGEQDGRPYLVTELLDGLTLRRKLARGSLPETTALGYADQLLQGLIAAHDQGIVHRDLKPDNVFVTIDERIKILDFGLAKLAPVDPPPEAPTQTGTGVVLGTPHYMAPEQVRGMAVDHRTDLFAVGVLLYEMLAGRRPFDADTSAETMTAILRQDPLPLPGVSPQLEQIVRHCLEKDPAARFQSARDLAFQLKLIPQISSPAAGRPSPDGRRVGRAVAASLVAVIVLGATAGVTWWLTRRSPTDANASLRRLTSDSGLTTDPAFSPDGRLIAYASDRAGAGNLDIWLQQLATGEAVQLTRDAADESEPTFSPDGSRIAFRSERDGGGIWSVSALGGEPRLIAAHGRRPRFSPDGTRLAYWVNTAAWYVGQIFIVPAAGGDRLPVQPAFASASYPVWSPDGTRLLFLGVRDAKDLPGNTLDWWIAPATGGTAAPTGALEILRRQGIVSGRGGQRLIAAEDWIGNDVFFAGGSDETMNLWRLTIAPESGKAAESPQKLTFGTALEAKPSALDQNRIAFASVSQALNIWSLNLTSDARGVIGTPSQVTSSVFDARTSVSADGKKLVFLSSRLGNPDVWIKDLGSGRETALTATPVREEEAELSADGSRVVYSVFEGSRGVFYQIAADGGVPERICEDCGRPWDWSPDGTKILFLIEEGRRSAPIALGVLDVATGQKTDYIVSAEYSVARARFSPDGRWISVSTFNASGTRLVVIPFRSGATPTEQEWIPITPHRPFMQDKARWSPDGTRLYYVSDVDGFRCIYVQGLDPMTRRPVGDPVDVYHSHSARRSLMNVRVPLFFELSVTAEQLFFNQGETTGNIWLAEWPARSKPATAFQRP